MHPSIHGRLNAVLVEDSVDGESEHVIQHSRDKYLEQVRGFFNTWIRIDLNKVALQILINDEVITDQFEGVLAELQLTFHSLKGLNDQLLVLIPDTLLDLFSVQALAGGLLCEIVLIKVFKNCIFTDNSWREI